MSAREHFDHVVAHLTERYGTTPLLATTGIAVVALVMTIGAPTGARSSDSSMAPIGAATPTTPTVSTGPSATSGAISSASTGAMSGALTGASPRPIEVDRRLSGERAEDLGPAELPEAWTSIVDLDPAAVITGIVERRQSGSETVAVGFTTPTAPADLANTYAWTLGLDGFVETARFDSGSRGPAAGLVAYERGTTTVTIALSWEAEATDAVITVARRLGQFADRVP